MSHPTKSVAPGPNAASSFQTGGATYACDAGSWLTVPIEVADILLQHGWIEVPAAFGIVSDHRYSAWADINAALTIGGNNIVVNGLRPHHRLGAISLDGSDGPLSQAFTGGEITSLEWGTAAEHLIDIQVTAQIVLPALDLTDCVALTTIYLNDNGAMTSVILPNHSVVTAFQAAACPFETIDLSNSSNLMSINLSGCALIDIDISACPSLSDVTVPANSLTTRTVNALLVALDNFGLSSGTVDTSDQTPLAPPTGAGATAAASLMDKGWLVYTD